MARQSRIPAADIRRALKDPRYRTLIALMVLVAVVCSAAGIWQVYRLYFKIDVNAELRANDHATVSPVSDVLPIVGQASDPGHHATNLRHVTATGHYDTAHQYLVRRQQVENAIGYLVLTPFTTSKATLLVVRGFIDQDNTATNSPTIPPVPAGDVTITGWVQVASTESDQPSDFPRDQVRVINAHEMAQRLAGPVYDGYATIGAGQPGTEGLIAIPPPSLSNPAGGAVEPQHLAYVIQWFLFALLALSAPVVMARNDLKDGYEPEVRSGLDEFDDAM